MESEKKIKVLQEYITCQIYGLQKVGSKVGSKYLIIDVEAETLKSLLIDVWKMKLPRVKTPLKACQEILGILDSMELIDKKQFKLEQERGRVRVKRRGKCVFSDACTAILDDKTDTRICNCSAIFIAAIELMLGKKYRVSQQKCEPDTECMIELMPAPVSIEEALG